MSNVGTEAKSSDDRNARLVVIDGLSATQSVLSNDTYNSTDILAVVIVTASVGNLTLSPKSGDTDIVLDNTELSALGEGHTFFGRYDSVTSDNAGTKVHLYHD